MYAFSMKTAALLINFNILELLQCSKTKFQNPLWPYFKAFFDLALKLDDSVKGALDKYNNFFFFGI